MSLSHLFGSIRLIWDCRGNATDLSLLPSMSDADIQKLQSLQSVGQSQSSEIGAFVLRNDLQAAWERLSSLKNARIDVVLDNGVLRNFLPLTPLHNGMLTKSVFLFSGIKLVLRWVRRIWRHRCRLGSRKSPQLFTDLALADFLVTHTSFVSKVVFQCVNRLSRFNLLAGVLKIILARSSFLGLFPTCYLQTSVCCFLHSLFLLQTSHKRLVPRGPHSSLLPVVRPKKNRAP